MAARIRKVTIGDTWRQKIRVSMLVNRLTDHALGKVSLSPTQVRAIEILLRKIAPDLQAIDHSGEVRQLHSFAVPLTEPEQVKAPTWERLKT